jgi:hypothetical protein
MRLVALAIALLFAATAAFAADTSLNGIRIVSPQLVLPPPTAMSAAAYMTIINEGTAPNLLIAVETDAAMHAMLHETVIGEDGIARMFELPPLIVAPGETFSFVGGVAHIMLMHLNDGYKVGDQVPFLLTFDVAGEIPVMFEVVATAPTGK